MEVLMFGWELPPFISGGLGVACQGLTRGLAGRGARIHFALPRPLPASVDYMDIVDSTMPGVKITAINSWIQSPYASNSSSLNSQIKTNFEYDPLYGYSIYQEAERFGEIAGRLAHKVKHEVIHAHDWMTYPAAIQAKKRSHKPYVAHVHATEFDRTGGNVDPRIAELEYQGLKNADAVIAVSQYTKDTIKRHYAVNDSKIHVVHNGVDLSSFQPADIRTIFPQDKIVLYVGRLTFQKGVEYLIKAAVQVLSTHPDTIFIIVGDGDMYRQHILQAASLNISQRIIFTGFLTGQRLQQVYQMADVFVMPSVSEPYGLVALEAIAAKTPVILSKQSGVSETITHAYTVDFWDTDKMARLIKTVFEYPQLSEYMTNAAYEQAKLLTWNKAAKQTLQVYQKVIGGIH